MSAVGSGVVISPEWLAVRAGVDSPPPRGVRMSMLVDKVTRTTIACTVLLGGVLSNRKGINRQGGGKDAKKRQGREQPIGLVAPLKAEKEQVRNREREQQEVVRAMTPDGIGQSQQRPDAQRVPHAAAQQRLPVERHGLAE